MYSSNTYMNIINCATKRVVEGLNDQEKSDILDIVLDRFNEEASLFLIEKEEFLDDTLKLSLNHEIKYIKEGFEISDMIDAIDTELLVEDLQKIADYFEEIDTLDIDDITDGVIKVNWSNGNQK